MIEITTDLKSSDNILVLVTPYMYVSTGRNNSRKKKIPGRALVKFIQRMYHHREDHVAALHQAGPRA